MTDDPDLRPPDETDAPDEPDGGAPRDVARDERGTPRRVDPDAPGRSLFDDGDAVEPNEPG